VNARLQGLVRGGWLQLGLALGIGYAAYRLASAVADEIVSVISQHAASPAADNSVFGELDLFNASPFVLNFHVGKTLVVYGYVLGPLIALGFVLFVRATLSAWAERDLLPCPHCLTLCPIEATICKACSLEMIEEEPESEPVLA
jgi:hypothetical protein